jgi:hypothetical protein
MRVAPETRVDVAAGKTYCVIGARLAASTTLQDAKALLPKSCKEESRNWRRDSRMRWRVDHLR